MFVSTLPLAGDADLWTAGAGGVLWRREGGAARGTRNSVARGQGRCSVHTVSAAQAGDAALTNARAALRGAFIMQKV